jgi:hypothetical protein
MQSMQRAKELLKMFNDLMGKSKETDDDKKKAEATAKMDKELGDEWRKHANPEGLEVIPIVEGGEPTEDKEHSLFKRLASMMRKNHVENEDLLNHEGIEEEEEEIEEGEPLEQQVQKRLKIGITICN